MRTLVYSEEAIKGLERIAAYISAEFSQARALKYLTDLSTVLEGLTMLPASYPIADKAKDPALRKLTFQKLTVVLYTFDNTSVYIEAVLDARSKWQ